MRSAKASFFTLIGAALIVVFSAFTAPKQDIFADIESALSIGNAQQFARYLNSSVELELPGEAEGIYSKQQTVAIMNRFFDRYPPSRFRIVHQGSSASGSRFAVGDYTTGEEKTFRVTVFIKKTGSAYLIQEIEFE